jgi:hypothetical protein
LNFPGKAVALRPIQKKGKFRIPSYVQIISLKESHVINKNSDFTKLGLMSIDNFKFMNDRTYAFAQESATV